MKLNILRGKIAWFGKHSGYEPLTDFFPIATDVNIITVGNSFWGRLTGKIFQTFFNWQKKNPQDTFAEYKLLNKTNSLNISHLLYLEGHIDLIEKTPKKKQGYLVGTIHLPMSEWNEEKLVLLSKFKHTIILYKEELSLFAKYMPINQIKFIRLGINIDFFKPDPNIKINANKVLIIGHYLRNFDMLYKVYNEIRKTYSNLEFHVIIPEMFRNIPAIIAMGKEKGVYFHQNLSDQELLEQYQNSNLLLIPMNDSGANTAIVQALAAGLPVITTDVGGIRSYGGGDIFPVVKNNDVDGMVDLFKTYQSDIEFRNAIAKKQRQFAVDFLDWKIIAQQHLEFYHSIKN